MVELPDWLSPFFIFQKSSQNAWHLIHCLKSWHLIRGYNLTYILQWICFHIGKPSFFRSLASNPNLRKSSEIRRFLALDFICMTSRLPSPHGTRKQYWCLIAPVRSRKQIDCQSSSQLILIVLGNKSFPSKSVRTYLLWFLTLYSYRSGCHLES